MNQVCNKKLPRGYFGSKGRVLVAVEVVEKLKKDYPSLQRGGRQLGSTVIIIIVLVPKWAISP